MGHDDAPTLAAMLEAARPAIERVLRRRFRGVDERARDCYQQVMLQLCGKFQRVIERIDEPLLNVEDYAARVTHHVVNEEIRPPTWSRLKNRILRSVSLDPRLARWDDPQYGLVVGYDERSPGQLTCGSVQELRRVAADLRSHALLGNRWENLAPEQWAVLLRKTFDAIGGPVHLNSLVSFFSELLEIRSEISVDERDEDEGGDSLLDRLESAEPTPIEIASLVEQLRTLWHCAQQLRHEWRLALLLNPPSAGTSGRGTSRGELDVLPEHGVASIEEIGAALELTREQFRLLNDGIESFAALWPHLPLPDKLIGTLLGKTGMQVLGLRKLAIRQVAHCMQSYSRGDGV